TAYRRFVTGSVGTARRRTSRSWRALARATRSPPGTWAGCCAALRPASAWPRAPGWPEPYCRCTATCPSARPGKGEPMAGSVERALHILVELASGPVTISELARRLEVHRTTSLRLLRVLEDERFVRRDDDGRYRLGPRMTTLAHAALEGLDSRTAARTHI